jgi:tight adherence protein B
MAAQVGTGRRPRARLALLAALVTAVAVVLLSAAASRARADQSSKERWDTVGENYHGKLGATLALASFPDRRLELTMPRQASLSPARVHVVEDGQPVVAVAITALAGTTRQSRYEVLYRSARPFGEREVELTVRVDGVDAVDLDYNAPAAAKRQAVAPPAARPPSAPRAGAGTTNAGHKPFLASRRAVLVVSAAVGLLLAVALLLFALPGRRRREMQERIRHFTPSRHSAPLLVAASPEQRLAATERMLARFGWWGSFKEKVELAHVGRSAAELAALAATATLVLAAVAVLLGAAPLAALALLLGPLALRGFVRHRLRQQRDLFAEQLSGFLDELSSSLRAGHGLVAGLATSVRNAPEPSRTEWGKVVADETLGVSLDAAMRSLGRRMDSDDVEQVALVATLHQRTGGNLAEVLDRVADGVRERIELRRQLRTLSAQARMSRWILTALPVVLALLMVLLNPTYARPLFSTVGGFIALGTAASLLTVGSLVMSKLTHIEV